MRHMTVNIGEHQCGKYNACDKCGSRTALITAYQCWSVDTEPFKDGELDDTLESEVDVSEELSAHYCRKCHKITSLSFNA
jgi:hypothetical protein